MKLTWDITNKCNLRCKHCAAVSLLEEDLPEYQDWRKVIDYVSSFVDSISLLGGEPLLHPEVEDIIKYANSKDMDVLIITNGQVDSTILDRIMNYEIKSILVSMEGFEANHDQVRGKGSWKKAMGSLKHLMELKKQKLAKTQIGVNIVANKLNRNEIINFIESTKELNICYQVSSLTLKGNAETNKDSLKIDTKELLDFFEAIADYHSKNPNIELNILNSYPIFKEYLNKKCGTTYGVQGFVCEALTGSIYADPYGNIYACQNFLDININMDDHNGWNDDFLKFKPLLELLHNKNTNNVCTMCHYQEECIPCPLGSNFKTPELCAEVFRRKNKLPLPLNTKFKLKKPYAIIESKERYEVFYPNLGSSTEYTVEGINILKSISDFKTLDDISKEVSIPPNIVYEFLLQEKHSSKVIEMRD